jgi:hypothetical protein
MYALSATVVVNAAIIASPFSTGLNKLNVVLTADSIVKTMSAVTEPVLFPAVSLNVVVVLMVPITSELGLTLVPSPNTLTCDPGVPPTIGVIVKVVTVPVTFQIKLGLSLATAVLDVCPLSNVNVTIVGGGIVVVLVVVVGAAVVVVVVEVVVPGAAVVVVEVVVPGAAVVVVEVVVVGAAVVVVEVVVVGAAVVVVVVDVEVVVEVVLVVVVVTAVPRFLNTVQPGKSVVVLSKVLSAVNMRNESGVDPGPLELAAAKNSLRNAALVTTRP